MSGLLPERSGRRRIPVDVPVFHDEGKPRRLLQEAKVPQWVTVDCNKVGAGPDRDDPDLAGASGAVLRIH